MAIRKLEVFLHDKQVGILKETDAGKLNFKYDEGTNIDDSISIRLPIREKAYNDKECRPFFENLLPEGNIRKTVAEKELISEENIFSILDKIGGDCAGAISLYEEGTKKNTDPQENELKGISSDELYKIIDEQAVSPLLTNEDIRLSLAGAQNKFAVFINNGQYFYPNDKYFSSHLIKPENPNWKDLVINEYFCMRLANKLKLNTYPVQIIKVNNKIALLAERYDRTSFYGHERSRLHQEDFCQALGYSSAQKYQKENGPSFKDCFKFIKDNFNISEAKQFMEILIFNYLIGNCDAHAKNFSVLYTPILKTGEAHFDGTPSTTISLAPFYDLVSTDAYNNVSKEMAMKIGSSWDIRNIQKSDFYKLAIENGIKEREIDNLISHFSDILETANEVKKEINEAGFDTTICDKIINGIKSRLNKISSES